MRLLQVQVPLDEADRLRKLIGRHAGVWSSLVRAEGPEEEQTVLLSVSVSNRAVGELVSAVTREIPRSELILLPQGVLRVAPPLGEVDPHVHEVTRRSTLELVLSSLQSLGSWRGMVLYAVLSGIAAAYAVVLDAVHLLVAAMLIAPMGAPAIVSVVGIAIGDLRMFGRGAGRFAASIGVLIVIAAVFGALVGLEHPTTTMEQLTSISRWTGLLAVVAGAAGAQSQIQSERSSLVSGSATGFLVAAALSPTSAVLGLSLVIGRWESAWLMAFQLALQFSGIAAGGWMVLAGFGVKPDDQTVGRGIRRWRWTLIGGISAAFAALVVLQSAAGASHARADLSRRAVSVAGEAAREVAGARPISVSARFTGAGAAGRAEPLLISIIVTAADERARPGGKLEDRVAESVRSALDRRLQGVVPFVVVTTARGAPAGVDP
jgi:uncharacterized membrane protein